MTTTKNNTAKIEQFLNSLDNRIEINNNLINYVDIENIDLSNAYHSIYEMVDENGGFDVEVIYYATAMEYLMNNDSSLRQSLELAADLGYSPENLNSEILATLLKSQNVKEEFSELESDINGFFADLEEEETED